MQKKIYLVLLFMLGACVLFSCKDALKSDQYFKDRLTTEKVFKSKVYTEQWLAHVYDELKGENADVASKGNTPHCFADDMFYGDRDKDFDPSKNELSYNMFKMGQYNENDKQGTWTQCYRGIRNASTFIQNVYMNTEMTPEEIEDYRGQARFARAYLYWLLLRKYGPIPLLPEEGIDYTDSYAELATPRSTYEECADYIANEMLQAAKEMQTLGMRRGQDGSARATCGAALATRAKVLIYAASPLANGNKSSFAARLTDDTGKRLLSEDYKEEKWAKAAAAARDVIELGVYNLYTAPLQATGSDATVIPPKDNNFSEKSWPGGWANIDPARSYAQVFDGTLQPSGNPELIFTRGTNQPNESIAQMVAHQLPRSATGWNTHGLTQKLVDAYYMNDGTDAPGKDKEIGRGNGSERVSGYVSQDDYNKGLYKPLRPNVSLQYANREPRFYASVAYNGSFWTLLNESEAVNRNQQVFYYIDDNKGNGMNSANAYWLRTGFGVKKFVHPSDTYQGGAESRIVPKAEPAIRYADILLLYAEALNELDGSYNIPSWRGENYTINRDIVQMQRGIHPVRIRGGVPDYPVSVYNSKNELRKALKRERFIELMGEGQRYYDLRRWMDAPVEESLPIYGCNVMMGSQEKDLFHRPVAVWALKTTFADKMWFWPISLNELKRNNRLTQNPGWNYND
ncbi:putative outer membrane starch-binding protein [Arcticibacter tournemirensis]|uniref:RagB/SusD family nutrient uptake outer membrane protein n=1 Tax=Arcticibacter tournemirensis TaxID=699437 RepID=A0A5M9HKM9_9SPHI|nr:RagB/SusD family nutrient uptake outer membrane protein [Arcticibacter tournemirensis]KAA8485547.1 RagB/SusD family nutrient uptake outer membrane protein [Arcticibacter tournemirensis]TQM48740.1 putative outer membrane starch-binding protein [Arcticibacter tournemirensis]